MELRVKDGKGIVTEREGTRFSRIATAEHKSPRVKALQGCVADRTKGKSADDREGWQQTFSKASKECKEELKL